MRNLLYILILFAGFPSAYILNWLCKEEIPKWRKELITISLVSIILILLISFTNLIYKFPIMFTLFFIIITCLTLIFKSEPKNSKKKSAKTNKK
jgi:hypothetical protein